MKEQIDQNGEDENLGMMPDSSIFAVLAGIALVQACREAIKEKIKSKIKKVYERVTDDPAWNE